MQPLDIPGICSELMTIRQALIAQPGAFVREAEYSFEGLREAIASLPSAETPAQRNAMLEVVRLVDDISALCGNARDFYGGWAAITGSLLAGYDSTGNPSVPSGSPSRLTARG